MAESGNNIQTQAEGQDKTLLSTLSEDSSWCVLPQNDQEDCIRPEERQTSDEDSQHREEEVIYRRQLEVASGNNSTVGPASDYLRNYQCAHTDSLTADIDEHYPCQVKDSNDGAKESYEPRHEDKRWKTPIENTEPHTDNETMVHLYLRSVSNDPPDRPSSCEYSGAHVVRSCSSSFSESGFLSSSGRSCDACRAASKHFLCDESKDFWNRIKGTECCSRVWSDFMDTLKEAFPNEQAIANLRVQNFLKCQLGIDMAEQLGKIHISKFLSLLTFFGPFKDVNNRCVILQQIEELVTKSAQRSSDKRTQISWFAGIMSRQEAEGKLKDQNPGTFLIRCSESMGSQGWFVLSLVMKDKSVDHFDIKSHPGKAAEESRCTMQLEFSGKTFTSLPNLVDTRFRQTVIEPEDSPEMGIRCITVCPGLPFNTIISGYKSAKSPK